MGGYFRGSDPGEWSRGHWFRRSRGRDPEGVGLPLGPSMVHPSTLSRVSAVVAYRGNGPSLSCLHTSPPGPVTSQSRVVGPTGSYPAKVSRHGGLLWYLTRRLYDLPRPTPSQTLGPSPSPRHDQHHPHSVTPATPTGPTGVSDEWTPRVGGTCTHMEKEPEQSPGEPRAVVESLRLVGAGLDRVPAVPQTQVGQDL